MQPVLPAANKSFQKGAARGPQKWVAGEKLWDTMVFHKQIDLLSKYPARTTVDNTGGNSSMYGVMKSPERFVSIEAFAQGINGKSCELFNGKRMAIGFSELAGVIEHLDFIISDGVERHFLHPDDGGKWNAITARVADQMSDDWTPVYKLNSMTMVIGHKTMPYWSIYAAQGGHAYNGFQLI